MVNIKRQAFARYRISYHLKEATGVSDFLLEKKAILRRCQVFRTSASFSMKLRLSKKRLYKDILSVKGFQVLIF